MRIVVALGGNALLQRGESPDADKQIENVRLAVAQLAKLASTHELVVTHGNGPQVGVFALESAHNESLSKPYPFDTLDAETQGMIGYWIVQAFNNELPEKEATALITRTLVSADDPAFGDPTKFIGEMYADKEDAERVASEYGWSVKADGQGYRRVVASPKPRGIAEEPVISSLVESGAIVVAAGGGGVPVVRTEDGKLEGVEAVVDKDLTGALLATQLHADRFLILTDVDGVMRDFGGPNQERIEKITVSELSREEFPAGSMGPKVQAAINFVEATGGRASIGRIQDVSDILDGVAGTTVIPD